MKHNKTVSNLTKQHPALKLVNQYADSYQIVQKENKLLSLEVQDLKMNLQISKTMINDLLGSLKPAQKEKAVIDGFKKELHLVHNTLDFYKKENEELKKGMSNNTSSNDMYITKYQKQIDSLSNKVFILENNIVKKDNVIRQLNKKIEDTLFYKELDGNIYVKETYLIDPQVTVNLIHEDLLLYKHVYEKISYSFKDFVNNNKQLEHMIDNLRLENSKLVNLIKNLKNSGNKEHHKLICKYIHIYINIVILCYYN